MDEKEKHTEPTGQTGQTGPTEPTGQPGQPGQEEQEEKKEQTGQKKKKKTYTPEQFNRKINYFIMRRMWQVIRGRSSTDTIYAAFATSRERITRIIKKGKVRYGKDELEYLVLITGVRREIFTGKARFKCPYKTTENTLVEDITEDEWEKLFDAIDEPEEKLRALPPEQKNIYEHLDMAEIFNPLNQDFFRLCYFLRNGKPVPAKGSVEQLKEIIKSIQGLSFSVLDNYEPADLEGLHRLLKEKYRLVEGILFYKKQKEK